MHKWNVKSDALLTTRSCDRYNGLKHDVTTNRTIAENCFLMCIDKGLNMLIKWRKSIFKIFFFG